LRILFVSQYFYPEVGAAAARIADLAKELSKLGHEIMVVSEVPNYPTGVVFRGYRGKLIHREKLNGIHVIRTFVSAFGRNSFFQRVILYLSFMLSSVIGAILMPKCDVVIATSPPLFVGLSGYVISRLRRCKFVFDVRDLWPESAVVLGELKKDSIFTSLAEALEKFIYGKADLISVAVPGFRNRILSKLKIPEKIEVITNGVDPSTFSDNLRLRAYWRRRNGFEGKFIVLFSGNHGLAQGLSTVLEAANILRIYEDIIFLFVGDGVEKGKLMRRKEELKLEHVIFWDNHPRGEMPGIISMSDVCLVPLRGVELFHNALPSKMYEYMACERPVILNFKWEAEEMIRMAGSGITVEPDDPHALAEAILKLYRNPSLRKELGRRGRSYVVENYNRKAIALKLANLLLELASGSS